jgi:hypothetical protein
MDNYDRIKNEIKSLKSELNNHGYWESYNSKETEHILENGDNTTIHIHLKETNIGGYFYYKCKVKRGKWIKEYKSGKKLLHSIETDFESDIREDKINNLLDEI